MIIDIVIILIFIVSIFIAYIRGLSSVIYQLASWIITIILIFVLCRPITNVIIDTTSLDESISESIQANLEENFGDDLEEGNTIDEEDSNISNSVIKLINGYIDEAKEEGSENITKYVSDEISYIAVSAIVILGIFIFARVVSILLKFILEVIVSIPIFGTVNKIGGIAYGVIRAFLIVYIVLAIISLLSPTLANTEIISMIKSSHIGSIFYNDNVILNFIQ